jgi:hypothetical protein
MGSQHRGEVAFGWDDDPDIVTFTHQTTNSFRKTSFGAAQISSV